MCSQDAIQAILSMKGSERKQWSITRQHGATRSNLHLIWNEEETLSTIGDHANLVEQRAKTFPSEGTDITTYHSWESLLMNLHLTSTLTSLISARRSAIYCSLPSVGDTKPGPARLTYRICANHWVSKISEKFPSRFLPFFWRFRVFLR